MKKVLEIIFKIILAVLIVAGAWFGIAKLVEFVQANEYTGIAVMIMMIVGIIIMVIAGCCACSKCCKSKKVNKDNLDKEKKVNNVVEMPKQEEAGGMTLLELLYYVITAVFIWWVISIFAETSEVFAKIGIMKMHLLWLALYDAFLLVSVRTNKIKPAKMIYIYTLIHGFFIANIIFNAPAVMPEAENIKEEVYLNNLPKFQIFEVIVFFVIYPMLKFFRKTQEEFQKENKEEK